MNCAQCGEAFEPYRSDQRFCSKRCRFVAWYARNREIVSRRNKAYYLASTPEADARHKATSAAWNRANRERRRELQRARYRRISPWPPGKRVAVRLMSTHWAIGEVADYPVGSRVVVRVGKGMVATACWKLRRWQEEAPRVVSV
jgi:predicted nucleic acid-binding Zn ribbon protein